ncbi:MAG: hypothetical protein ACYTCU_01720 [Planctomycetota bacterium]|jgi:hypothetical protein
MPTLISTALACLLGLGATLPGPQPTNSHASQPDRQVALVDALDMLLALHEPGPGVVNVEVVEVDDRLVATVTRVVHEPGSEALWIYRTVYVFASTIYAHSAGDNGFQADEMD